MSHNDTSDLGAYGGGSNGFDFSGGVKTEILDFCSIFMRPLVRFTYYFHEGKDMVHKLFYLKSCINCLILIPAM